MSAVIALATPRRIKASHRRRRRVASDHLLYILNNPLSGTDPTGYASCSTDASAGDCAAAAGSGGTAKVTSQQAGSHIKTTVGSVTNNGNGTATVTANSGKSQGISLNGANLGSRVTNTFNQTKDKISEIGSAVKSRAKDAFNSVAPQSARLSAMSDEQRNDQDSSPLWGAAGFYNTGAGAFNDVLQVWASTVTQGRISDNRPYPVFDVPENQVRSAAMGEGILNLATMPIAEVRGAQGVRGAAIAKPSLSAHKRALLAVQAEVGRLPKGAPGRFGSPQAGTSKKGYRLDPPHDGVAKGDAEAKYHFNWWDYSGGKRGNGGRSGAIPIED